MVSLELLFTKCSLILTQDHKYRSLTMRVKDITNDLQVHLANHFHSMKSFGIFGVILLDANCLKSTSFHNKCPDLKTT